MKKQLLILLLFAIPLFGMGQHLRWEQIKPFDAQVEMTSPAQGDLILVQDTTDDSRKYIKVANLVTAAIPTCMAADSVSVADTAGYYTADNAEQVLREVGDTLRALRTDLASAAGGGTNIYNANGNLTGNRNLDLSSYSLTFQQGTTSLMTLTSYASLLQFIPTGDNYSYLQLTDGVLESRFKGSTGKYGELQLDQNGFTFEHYLTNSNSVYTLFQAPSSSSTVFASFSASSDGGSNWKYFDISEDLISSDMPIQINSKPVPTLSSGAPASASDTGTAGEMRYDSNYLYICIATNTWRRVAITTW